MSSSKGQREIYIAKRVFISILQVQAQRSPINRLRESQRLRPMRCQTPDQRGKQVVPAVLKSVSPFFKPKHVKVDLSAEDSIYLPQEHQTKRTRKSPLRSDRANIDLKRGSFSKKQITTCGMYNNWVGFDNISTQIPSRSPSPAVTGRNSKLKELSTNFRLEKSTLRNTPCKCTVSNKENIEQCFPLENFIQDLDQISRILPVCSRRPERTRLV